MTKKKIGNKSTSHKIFYKDARQMNFLEAESVDLMVTSPPYPMISMWDEMFSKHNSKIRLALSKKRGKQAFELMHKELDKIWDETYRVLKVGGIACINIGNATRTINGDFQLYPNHSRIIKHCFDIGFEILPLIIWRKQTNAPNKFMGSGMLPISAYITLEHEFILILRKQGKRKFETIDQKLNRQESSFFWEERNLWFSDVWFDIKGANQKLLDKELRKRSGAFPFDLAYRLISMYSVKSDVVLDPFLGTGTTVLASMISERNSIGIEIDRNFRRIIDKTLEKAVDQSVDIINKRINGHKKFIKERLEKKLTLKYKNKKYGFAVMTKSEKEIIFNKIVKIEKSNKNNYKALYE